MRLLYFCYKQTKLLWLLSWLFELTDRTTIDFILLPQKVKTKKYIYLFLEDRDWVPKIFYVHLVRFIKAMSTLIFTPTCTLQNTVLAAWQFSHQGRSRSRGTRTSVCRRNSKGSWSTDTHQWLHSLHYTVSSSWSLSSHLGGQMRIHESGTTSIYFLEKIY